MEILGGKMTPRQKLDALADLLAPDIRSAFLAGIQDIVDNVLLRQLVEAIQLGDVEGAFRALGYSPAAMRPITAAIERAYERGGVLTGETFPKWLNTTNGRAIFRFDLRNSRSEAWLREYSSALITRIEDETRVNVRSMLAVGMQAGRNPRSVALDIVGRVDPSTNKRVGGIVGLTVNQERWVTNTRIKLETLDATYFDRELRDKRFDSIVKKAIDAGKPLPQDTVDKLTARYKMNALRYRGEAIGRTEAIRALNRSEYEAVLQASELGAINKSATKRIWDSAGDGRVRWSHRKMDGQAVGIDEPFVSPSGARMMFPGDTSLGAGGDETIMCRCRARLKVDWLDDLD
jgi:hypothetical protein